MSALQIQLNGEPHQLSAPCNLQQLVSKLSVNLHNVAIEHNQVIIPKPKLAEVNLSSGDRVEVVEFIGGG